MTAPKTENPKPTPRFTCAKFQSRLWIRDGNSGELIYTPPDFIRFHNRQLMYTLADRSNIRGHLDIEDIIMLEAMAPRASGYTPRTKNAELVWPALPSQQMPPAGQETI